VEEVLNTVQLGGYTHLINGGRSDFPHIESANGRPITVFNQGPDIKPLTTPGGTRLLLPTFIPPRPASYPADIWYKGPGRGGVNKNQQFSTYGPVGELDPEWDCQLHIEGQEFRLITVGHKIVQQFERHGSNENREYFWVAQYELNQGLKNHVRQAATKITGNNIIAWDCILSTEGNPYILEGNTCPGVNQRTVERILKEIEVTYLG
jgi:hypothetical protein